MSIATPSGPLRWDYAPAPESRDAASLKPRYDLFIGGEFRRAEGRHARQTINPANEEPLAEVAFAGAEGRRARRRGRPRRGAEVGARCRRWSAASTCSGSRG